MTRMPALSLAAVPGRRLATIALAQEIEKRGFSGIFGPSLGSGSTCFRSFGVNFNSVGNFRNAGGDPRAHTAHRFVQN